MSADRLSICIVSRKDIFRVTRVPRVAKALSDAGHNVTVLSLKRPHDELTESAPEVAFVDLPRPVLNHVEDRVLIATFRKSAAFVVPLQRLLPRKVPAAPRAVAMAGRVLGARGRAPKMLAAFRVPFLADRNRWQAPEDQAERASVPELIEGLRKHERAEFEEQLGRQLDLDIRFAATGIRLTARKAFDVVHAHDYMSLISADLIARHHRANLVYDAVEISESRASNVDIPLPQRTKDRVLRTIEAGLIGRTAALTTVGDGLAAWYAERFNITPPSVIRNCRYFVPRTGDLRLREDLGLGVDVPLIAWFGYGYPGQGLMFLVDIMTHLPETYRLVLLVEFRQGWKAFEAEFKDYVASQGVANRVFLLPLRPPNDLIPYISSADIGIIPRPPEDSLNVRHSLPNKFFEMVMARLPIACTDLPDVQSLLARYDIGVRIDAGDAASAAMTVHSLMVRAKFGALSDNLERAAVDLSWEQEALKLADLYDGLVASHSRHST